MSDFFSRLIQRTMGYAETVQPLVSPVYGGLSNEESSLNLQTENLARIEESENINAVKNPVYNLSFPPDGNPSFNLTNKDAPEQVRDMTSPGDTLLNSRINKLPSKDIGRIYYSTEKDSIDKLDTEPLDKKEPLTLNDSKNKSTGRFSLNLLPENRSTTVNKSSDPFLSADSQETDTKEKGTIVNEKRNDEKASHHLLPLSFKDILSFEKIGKVEYKKSSIKNNIYSDIKLSPQAPTVKVNIKRVEVKAVIQQKIKQRHALKHEPKLSLDEYLKQRKSGER